MPNIDVNGETIDYPDVGDPNWGDNATNFAIQTSAALGKIGLSSGTSVDITQTLDVTGNTTLDANLSVGGNASVTGNLTVNGNTQLGNANTDSIEVTGIVNIDSGVLYVDPVNNRVGINDTTPSQALDVTGNVAITGNETVGGTLGVTGDVAINTNKFNVIANSGNTTIAGTLGISNGTALAPAITPSEDTDTGLYSIGANKIGFAANGIRQGEFGIGYGGFTGNIIQVVNSENDYTHNITTTANWNSDLLSGVGTSWEISITPKYSNSKIILNALINGYVSSSSSTYFGISIWRKIGAGAYSQIYIPMTDTISSYEIGYAGSSTALYSSFPRLYVDSPNTTSQINYKFSIRVYTGSTFVHSLFPSSVAKSKSFCVLQEVQQ